MENRTAQTPTTTYITTSESGVAPTTCTCNDNIKPLKCTEAALASLVGIFVVLLTVVTIGWVYTCWTLKRIIREKASLALRYTNVLYNMMQWIASWLTSSMSKIQTHSTMD